MKSKALYIGKEELQKKGYFASLNSVVNCHCGECITEDLFYECELCDRNVPFCYGQADQFYELCDDCADQQYSNKTTTSTI